MAVLRKQKTKHKNKATELHKVLLVLFANDIYTKISKIREKKTICATSIYRFQQIYKRKS